MALTSESPDVSAARAAFISAYNAAYDRAMSERPVTGPAPAPEAGPETSDTSAWSSFAPEGGHGLFW
jgi:hypothetical protein